MDLIEWIKIDELNKLYTYDYWNDKEREKQKDWWIESKDDIAKVENYLLKSGLYEEFNIFLNEAKQQELVKGKVLDIAAGVCWTTALLSKEKLVSRIDALEFSLHRINEIAPLVIDGLKGKEEKIRRILGSFYNIKEKDYDLIFMSQAFHHAEKPLYLLYECDKALKHGGSIVLIGEHLIKNKHYFRKILTNFIRKRKVETNFYELFTPDNILGDHYYRLSDYYFLFQSLGYKVQHYPSNIRGSMILIAKK